MCALFPLVHSWSFPADTREVIFNTTSGSGDFNDLVFEDQYIELSTQVEQDPFVYGLGERMDNFKLSTNKTYTLWNVDQVRHS
jgi:alpha-glucosidase (family GH31 glycosyl hydrolase)